MTKNSGHSMDFLKYCIEPHWDYLLKLDCKVWINEPNYKFCFFLELQWLWIATGSTTTYKSSRILSMREAIRHRNDDTWDFFLKSELYVTVIVHVPNVFWQKTCLPSKHDYTIYNSLMNNEHLISLESVEMLIVVFF